MSDNTVVGYERAGKFRHAKCKPSGWKGDDVRAVRMCDDDADQKCGRCSESLFY